MTWIIKFSSVTVGAVLALALAVMPTNADESPTKLSVASQPERKTFTLFVYEPVQRFTDRTDPVKAEGYWKSFAAYGDLLASAGVLRGGAAVLPPSIGRAVTVVNGTMQATAINADVSGLEIGGSFVVEVESLEEAVRWASKCPAAIGGKVVVRENVPMSPAMRSSNTAAPTSPQGAGK